jgi:hypothetical protein
MKMLFKIIGFLLLIGVVLFGYIFYIGSSRGPVIEKQVTEFLQLASDGKMIAAYEYLSIETKEGVALEAFSTAITNHFAGLSFVRQRQDGYYFNLVLKTRGGLLRYWPKGMYEYQGTVFYNENRAGGILLTFIKERGNWKILRFDIGNP